MDFDYYIIYLFKLFLCPLSTQFRAPEEYLLWEMELLSVQRKWDMVAFIHSIFDPSQFLDHMWLEQSFRYV